MRSLVIFLLILPSCLWAGELEDLVKNLSSDEFKTRNAAHQSLIEKLPTHAEALRDLALQTFADTKADPELRIRLFSLLKTIAREGQAFGVEDAFQEKNGFIGINIMAGQIFARDPEKGPQPVVGVREVMEGLQGDKAGLKANDQIVLIDGEPFETAEPTIEFMERIGFSVPGKKVRLNIRRAGKPMDIDVELMKRPENLPPGMYDPAKDFEKSFEDWLEKNTVKP